MLPNTARKDDIVEVINKESEYFEMIGKISKNLNKSDCTVTVNLYGNTVTFNKDELRMKARKGTVRYREFKEKVEEQHTKNLINEDYDELINLALSLEDWGWATSLVNRKKKERSK